MQLANVHGEVARVARWGAAVEARAVEVALGDDVAERRVGGRLDVRSVLLAVHHAPRQILVACVAKDAAIRVLVVAFKQIVITVLNWVARQRGERVGEQTHMTVGKALRQVQQTQCTSSDTHQ